MKKILLTASLILSTILAFGQGYALDFDGTNDYVEITNQGTGILGNNTDDESFTIETWFQYAGSGNYSAIFTRHSRPSNTNYGYFMEASGNTVRIGYGSNPENDEWNFVYGTTNVKDGNWHHLVYVYNKDVSDNGSITLYIDGVAEASANITGAINTSQASIDFRMMSSETWGSYTAGKLDEFRIWNDVRTVDEIRANMHRELIGEEENLIAYFKMSDITGTTLEDNDDAGTYDGNITNGAVQASSGCFAGPGNALNFDGSNKVTLPPVLYTANFNGGNAITIEYWFKGSEIQSAVRFQNTSNHYIVAGWGDPPQFIISSDGATDGVLIGAEAEDENWHHIACVWEANTINGFRTYLDGVLRDQKVGTSAAALPSIESGGSWLGSYNEQEYMTGQLDEVRIWNTARTIDDLRQNMHRTLEGTEANLVAYYRMDQQDGTTAYDLSGSGYNGTLTGDPTWIASTAFNTWLGGTSASWTETTNWSLGSAPVGESVGIFDWNIGDAASDPTVADGASFQNLYIEDGATPTFAGNFTASGNVFINNSISLPNDASASTISGDLIVSSGTVSMLPGSKLTVSGDLTNAGTIALSSPANAGPTASLIVEGTQTNTGTMSIQRWVSGGSTDAGDFTWHSMGIPVTSATTGQFFTGDYVLSYSEPNNNWSNIEGTDVNLTVGEGYLVKTVSGPKTYSFSGTFNSGETVINLDNTGSDASHGYNMISNPYPSSLDLNAITLNSVNNTFYIWNPGAAGGSNANYWTYQIGGSGTGSFTSGEIQPCQGFFVKVTNGSASGSVGLNSDGLDQTHGTLNFIKKSAKSSPSTIRLKAFNDIGFDEVIINHSDIENQGYKIFSMNSDMPQIYVHQSEHDFVIYNEKELNENLIIPLGYYSKTLGQASIVMNQNTFQNYDIYLQDLIAESEVKITEVGTEYFFNHQVEEETGRFQLVLTPSGTTGIENILTSEIDWCDIASHQAGVEIRISNTNFSEVKVYDILGAMIKTEQLATGTNLLTLDKKGIYIIHLSSEFGTLTEKHIFFK